MAYIMVDIEADGPIPGDHSMVCFGAIVVEPALDRTFYGRLKPISDKWIPEALQVSGFTREETLDFDDPTIVMQQFADWVAEVGGGRPMFISDNNGFDWQFINWYFHHFLGKTPFGHSSTNLGSLYKGVVRDTFASFKHLRTTKHTHHPVDDARGNAEALLHIKEEFGLKIKLKRGSVDMPSSRTPEGQPNRCPTCGNEIRIEPSIPPGDAPCPRCGALAWFSAAARNNEILVDQVQDLDVATKDEAIRSLVGRLSELGLVLPDVSDEIVAKIKAREELGAAGVGGGVAVPHARHPSVRRTVGIVGYAAKGIDFNSLDGRPVRTVVLLLSPTDKPVEHLRTLEWISKTLRDAQL